MQKRTAGRRFFFAVVYPGGGGFKRRGPEPPPLSLQGDRILKERGKFEIPLSLSGVLWLLSFAMERQLTPQIFDLAGGSYAQLSSLRPQAQHPPAGGKKRSPRRKTIFTIPPAAAGGLYIYLTPSGVRYYLSPAVRPGIIKHKKRKAQRASNLYSPHPRQGVG